MRARRPIFVKLVPFQLGGRGNTFEGATPSYVTDSRSSILGLSNEVSFVSQSYVVAVSGVNETNLAGAARTCRRGVLKNNQ